MEKPINERLIMFTGKSCLGKALAIGDDFFFKVKGSVLKIEDIDNQDGTIDKVYKVKLLSADEE